jgi:hypothetical protein
MIIECGIGTISANSDNLALKELIEALDKIIQRDGAIAVRNMLEGNLISA